MGSLNKNTDPHNKSVLESGLPEYLQNDIYALSEGIENNSTMLDCLICEVEGSINAAYWDNEITKEQYDYLWEIYG